VQACGEMAARKLLERQKAISLEFAIPQYVKQNAGNYTPINEGFPNGAHLETILAERTVGVWNEDKVKTIFEDHGQTSPVRYFNVAPAFFDELTKIADDLLFVDVNRRTESLRTKLNVLESQYLPSNLIYVPFFSREHVVWRIVSKESFAISTKERVPCFVTLECVNISEDDEDTDELLNWYKTPRHPQRFNTIFQIINQKGRAALKGVIKLRQSTSGVSVLNFISTTRLRKTRTYIQNLYSLIWQLIITEWLKIKNEKGGKKMLSHRILVILDSGRYLRHQILV